MLHPKARRVRKVASRRRVLKLESLETRQMLAGDLDITPNAQLLIELINRARGNPATEAARYGIGLNDNVPAGATISTASKQPLAPHQALVDAAVAHSLDMLERDFFAHDTPAPNSTSPSDRARAAGYPADAGENIGWGGSTGPIDQVDHVYARHESLFKSVGHRINMLLPDYRELGTAIEYGVFTAYNSGAQRYLDYNASMATEMFSSRGGNHFITGVAYDDSVDDNNFYNIGEGEGGLIVQAENAAGTVFQTTTADAGGYSMQVPDGTYTVRFVQSGSSLYADLGSVVVNGFNVKVDLDSAEATWQSSISATAISLIDATTFGGSDTLDTTATSTQSIGDEFVPIDPTESYLLTGQARAGNDAGGQFSAANRQYLGFASYDADQLRIEPWQVFRVPGAADTALARPLRPGDTQIVLLDASGWANAGAAHQRSLAWYGYTNQDGFTYPDYTYTRNVATDFSDGMWSPGGVSGNVITLRNPWNGPEIQAGTAVRNATSGGTFNYAALAGGSVPQAWTDYSATLTGTGLSAHQFRPGTAFIKPILLNNYGTGTPNRIRWQNVDIRYATANHAYDAGTTIDLDVDLGTGIDATSYQWTQLSGPSVLLTDSQTERPRAELPASQSDYQIVLQVAANLSGTLTTDTLTINVQGVAAFEVAALLDATRFDGSADIASTAPRVRFVGDQLVPVNPAERYELTADARSGNDTGGQYNASNRQYFGFASYDVDQQSIAPWHVSRYGNAADTRLAATLRPGDTQIVLQSAVGWANAGLAYQRSLAWYGYTNGDGYTYPDYTYTRNVARDFTHGLWNSGGISGNVITLRQPWDGPQLDAGTAVRNATSSGTYNYAGLSGAAIPDTWTQYSSIVTGTGLSPNQFRPGTAFIQPIVLTNYQGNTTNLVRWANIDVRYAGALHSRNAGDTIDLGFDLDNLGTVADSYQWSQLSGPTATISNVNMARPSLQLPISETDYQIVMQLSQTTDGVTTSDTLTLHVKGVPNFEAVALLDATRFSGQEEYSTVQPFQTVWGDGFVAIDPTDTYRITADARSGNDVGGQYVANNKQLAGFASFDVDQQRIEPWHVLKYSNATDTHLATTLRPGDTTIVLNNASGWANAGAAHQRSFAWYGYTNELGFTYADYTYTRNVVKDFGNGMWNPGGISGNVITLRQPWSGPTIAAETAVRNATSGATYNYALATGQAVPNQWTSYSATLSGTGLARNQFRPGTAYIRPLLLTNYQGGTNNLVLWQNVDVRHASPLHPFVAGTDVDVAVDLDNPGPPAIPTTFDWKQLAGPQVVLLSPDSSRARFTLPNLVGDYQVVLQLAKTSGGVTIYDTVTLDVQA